MKTVESLKYYLMGHTSRSMEDSGAKSYLNCWRLTEKILENKFSILPRDCYCDILVKKVACLKSLPEAKVNIF